MKVTVKYFGMIAEAVGKNEEILELADGTTAADFRNRQIEKFKIADPDSVQLAVNQDLYSEEVLNENDEVAFLPPFAGG